MSIWLSEDDARATTPGGYENIPPRVRGVRRFFIMLRRNISAGHRRKIAGLAVLTAIICLGIVGGCSDDGSSVGPKSKYYDVTYNANGGTVTPRYGTTKSNGKLDSLPIPKWTKNREFNGWFSADSGGTEITTATVFNKDSIIHAQWTLNIYSITLDANGGTLGGTAETATRTTNDDGKLDSLPTPTRKGYTFDGWFTEKTGGSKISGECSPKDTWHFLLPLRKNIMICRGTP